MAKVIDRFMIQVYLETHPFLDPTCETYCGPGLPYMYYDGDAFCVTDANVEGRWVYIDYTSSTSYSTDPPVIVTCLD